MDGKKTIHKVKYIGGSGIELPYPLSDGRTTIPGHRVIELTDYSDFVRLTESPLFKEVKDEEPASRTRTIPVTKPTTATTTENGD